MRVEIKWTLAFFMFVYEEDSYVEVPGFISVPFSITACICPPLIPITPQPKMGRAMAVGGRAYAVLTQQSIQNCSSIRMER